jgi:hypothetical protein
MRIACILSTEGPNIVNNTSGRGTVLEGRRE